MQILSPTWVILETTSQLDLSKSEQVLVFKFYNLTMVLFLLKQLVHCVLAIFVLHIQISQVIGLIFGRVKHDQHLFSQMHYSLRGGTYIIPDEWKLTMNSAVICK